MELECQEISCFCKCCQRMACCRLRPSINGFMLITNQKQIELPLDAATVGLGLDGTPGPRRGHRHSSTNSTYESGHPASIRGSAGNRLAP